MSPQFAGVRLIDASAIGVERRHPHAWSSAPAPVSVSTRLGRSRLDIAECEFRSRRIGLASPAGSVIPGLHVYEGEDGLAGRESFSGLLVTCGLDHNT